MGEIIANIMAVLALLAGFVAFPILLILLVYRFIRAVGYAIGVGFREAFGKIPARNCTPMQLLQERYAKGEIDHAEFEERRRHLLASQ